jgi:chromate transporter
LRYVLVVKRRWLSEEEFAETFGMCQALPGAVGANLSVIVGDRFAGWRGAVVAVVAFSVPAMIFAVCLAMLAIALAAVSPRIAHAEIAIVAVTAGLSIGNGVRIGWHLWRGADAAGEPIYRLARVGVSGVGIALVVAWHLWLPYVVGIMMAGGLLLERVRGKWFR